MKIGLLLPAHYAVGQPANGVRVQAWRQAAALERAGHSVTRLDSWVIHHPDQLDFVHAFAVGYHMQTIEHMRGVYMPRLAIAPIIDSNQSNRMYRLSAWLGTRAPKINTLQGEYRKQALGADVVIVRSTHERDRIVYGLGINPAKVAIVLNGCDAPSDADPDGVRKRLDLPDEFALHISAYTQDRKNVVRLIEAVGPTGHPLVIGGVAKPGPVLDRIRDLVRQYPQVRLLGFLDEATLNGLYAACKVFCLPTTHEGTGLAALEAAALGAKVIITKNGGPPDYFLNLAEYVDPFDVADIRAAFLRAWEAPPSDDLQRHVRTNLTWDASARSLVQAYQRCMSSVR